LKAAEKELKISSKLARKTLKKAAKNQLTLTKHLQKRTSVANNNNNVNMFINAAKQKHNPQNNLRA